MNPEHTAMLAAADQEAEALDQILDCYIKADRIIKRDNPQHDEGQVRAVQIYLINQYTTGMSRGDLVCLIAAAVGGLAANDA